MAFYAEELIYNGTSSKKFGLSIYDFDSNRQETNGFQDVRTAVEDKMARRHRTQYYGSTQNNQLELTFVLGLCQDRVDNDEPLTVPEKEAISFWLNGDDGYHYLEIVQPDMREYRYKARVSAAESVEAYWSDWAVKVVFTCDSGFAYRYPEKFTYMVDRETEAVLCSRSTYGNVYWPHIKVTFTDDQDRIFELHNAEQGDAAVMRFAGVPTAVKTLYINTDTKVILSDSGDAVYPYFNFKYTGLFPGDNHLTMKGNCTVEFLCEFPVSIGG